MLLFAKELNNQIYLARYTGVDPVDSDWYPVAVGLKPNLFRSSSTQFILTLEFLSSVYAIGIDANVWPPLFLNPIDNHGSFTQVTQSSDSVAAGQHTTASARTYLPALAEQIFLKANSGIYYDPTTNTYSSSISLDFSRFTQPIGWRGYRIYERTNFGPWVLFRDYASDFQNIPVSQVGVWNKQYCAVWGWLWDPDLRNQGDIPVQSPIANAPILTIPASPITLLLTISDQIFYRYGVDGFSGLQSQPPLQYYVAVAEEILHYGPNVNSPNYVADRPELFQVPTSDPSEVFLVSNHSSAGLVGGLR